MQKLLTLNQAWIVVFISLFFVVVVVFLVMFFKHLTTLVYTVPFTLHKVEPFGINIYIYTNVFVQGIVKAALAPDKHVRGKHFRHPSQHNNHQSWQQKQILLCMCAHHTHNVSKTFTHTHTHTHSVWNRNPVFKI